jgi:hypothetical protein
VGKHQPVSGGPRKNKKVEKKHIPSLFLSWDTRLLLHFSSRRTPGTPVLRCKISDSPVSLFLQFQMAVGDFSASIVT